MSRAARRLIAQPAGERHASPAGPLSATHPRLRALARLGYAVIVLFATLPGTGWSFEPALVMARLARAFVQSPTTTHALDAIRNVALFAGFGVVWIATTRTRFLWPAVWRATLVGMLLSILVEAVQLTSPVRITSVYDVATNALGAFLGALATAVVVRGTRWELERAPGAAPALLVAASYLGATALEAFSPLGRPDNVPGGFGGPGRRLAASLAWLADHATAPPSVWDVLLFIPAGAVAAWALVAHGLAPLRAAIGSTLAAAGLYVLAELARGAAGGDMRPLAVAARVAAVAVGGALAAGLAERRPMRSGGTGAGLLAGVAAVLAVWYWRPFVLRPGLAGVVEADHLVPLRAFLGFATVYVVADVAVDFLLFFALGVWLALRPLRARGAWRGAAPALWLALLLEAGQIWLATRTFDVTDVLVQWAGALVGWAVVRQTRLRARGPETGVPARAVRGPQRLEPIAFPGPRH